MAAPVSQRLTPRRRAQFCDALAQCGNVTEAAAAIGCSRQAIYLLRERDPEFAAQMDDALHQAADKLVSVAFVHAVDGWLEPAINAKGVVYWPDGSPVMIRKYDSRLHEALLKAFDPRFNPVQKVEHSGTVNVQAIAQVFQTALDRALPQDVELRERVAQALLQAAEEAGPA